MKKKYTNLWIILLLSSMLAACTKPLPDEPSSNFDFVFGYGACFTDILNTSEGTFTQDMLNEPDAMITLQLSAAQLTTIYQKMVEIGFFRYPEVFSIPTPPNGVVGIITPAMEYDITVRNGEITKSLSWVDEITDPNTLEADQLRDLFQLIMKMIQEHPNFQKLPERKEGCV